MAFSLLSTDVSCPLCTLQAEDGGIAALPPLRGLYASGGDGGVGEGGAGENAHHC